MGFSRTKKLQAMLSAASLTLLFFSSACVADTFTHRRTNEVLHGYATSQTEGSKTTVHTQEKGAVRLNLAEWDITADRRGRNNKVIILTLDDAIMFIIETQAMEQAIAKASDEGPLCILLEIDTPGGQTDFAQRICGAITQARNCQVIAYIKGGQYGGAISAGAAVALACDKIYMANNTVIGAALLVALSEAGPEDFEKTYGETITEKFSSLWRAYLASLAEQNRRPGLLARAMVDKDIEVVEVSDADNRRLFIEPVNKSPQQRLVHTWSKKGSLLTLTAEEAVKCGIADKIVSSRQQLLQDLKVTGAEIVINNDTQNAGKELKRAVEQLNRIRKSVDLKIKQSQYPQTTHKILKDLRSAKSEFRTLIRLAKKYPDLQLNIQDLEDELNSIEAAYEKVKRDSKRR